MNDRFPSLNEDLSSEPTRAVLQAIFCERIEAGVEPHELVEAAFVAAAALSIDVSGLAKTALYLLDVGSRLASGSPAIQAMAAANLREIARTRAGLGGADERDPKPRADH